MRIVIEKSVLCFFADACLAVGGISLFLEDIGGNLMLFVLSFSLGIGF